MEIIVFNQHQLDAVSDGIMSVALCDNDYIISPVKGREYIAIGNVDAVVNCTAIEAIAMGLTFVGFIPVFDNNARIPEAKKEEATSFKDSFTSSFATSFATSFTTSFASSFTTLFATSFATSFTTSFATSFATSFTTSFATSFTTSFATSFATSFTTSFKTSYKSSFAGSFIPQKRQVVREIAVNGYGLNLI